MSSPFPFSPAGLDSVDTKWGGFKKGGTYLLVGHAQAGRPQHLMSTVRAAIQAGEHCLLISARPQAALVELAAKIGLDLPRASQLGKMRLLKAPPGKDLAAIGDEGLTKALGDLIQLARSHEAGRVVVDDFSAFVQFRVFDSFAEVFRQLVRDAAIAESTFILGLGEPANEPSKTLLHFIESQVSGTIHATMDGDEMSHFELIAGSAHHSESAQTEPRLTEELVEQPSEGHSGAGQTEQRKPSTPPPDFASLPPFELSIPTSDGGGNGSNTLTDEPDLVVPPSGPESKFESPPFLQPDASGDTAWAHILPVSPADAPPLATGRDPFANDIGDLSTIGYFIDSAGPEKKSNRSEPSPIPSLEEEATAIQKAAYPELFAPIAASDSTTQFRQLLADAFAKRGSAPFLVMAFRISPDDPHVDAFPAVTEGVRIGIGQSATMIAERYRLMALIPNAGADVARNVFAILKAHLKTVLPGRTETVLQHISAMAVPDGEPFKTADDLFAHAFGN